MPTLKDRAPELFETIAVDESGRPLDDPKKPGKRLVTGPRTPSKAEVIKFVLSSTRNASDDSTASQIIGALDELAAMPPPEATAASTDTSTPTDTSAPAEESTPKRTWGRGAKP
jgi:hypothetical protein